MGSTTVAQNAASNEVAGSTAGRTELGRQSVSIPAVHNLDGIKTLFAKDDGSLNEDALVRFVNMGLRQGLNNAVRRELTQKDDKGKSAFTFVDGIFDTKPLIQKEPERQRRSFVEKLEKQLRDAGQPQAIIDVMLKTYNDNVGQEQTSDITSDVVEVVLWQEGSGDKAKFVMKAASREEEEE